MEFCQIPERERTFKRVRAINSCEYSQVRTSAYTLNYVISEINKTLRDRDYCFHWKSANYLLKTQILDQIWFAKSAHVDKNNRGVFKFVD